MTDVLGMRAADRGVLVGTSGTGKSTLAAHVLACFRREYPDSRILVLDTKPRWRADRVVSGGRAGRLYRKYGKGDMIPGSVSLSDMSDWNLAWAKDAFPTQTVIAQRLSGSQEANVAFQILCAQRFFDTQTYARPSMIYLDEGHDFFHTNSAARSASDIIQRCTRAGRERNLATLVGLQRPKGVNLQVLTETSWIALFRLKYAEDIRRLAELGWPTNASAPGWDEPFVFRLWRDTTPGAPKYKLDR